MATPLRIAPPSPLDELAGAQAGALSRQQALDSGLTRRQIDHRVARGSWQRVFPGTYVTHAGPTSYLTRAWCAVLYVGHGAVLCLETAEYFWGLRDQPPADIHVMIPSQRRVKSQPGLRLHIRQFLHERTHPARLPPLTRVEDTVLDVVARATSPDHVIDILLRACQRRRTTATKLVRSAECRKKLRWRALVEDVLSDVRGGVLTAIERRYQRDVEIAHKLPESRRNVREGRKGRARYRDVDYPDYGVVVELDGRTAHPDEERHRDMRRDNAVAEEGRQTLRYGWTDIATFPCQSAGQVARVLRVRGWTGLPGRCGPACAIDGPTPP